MRPSSTVLLLGSPITDWDPAVAVLSSEHRVVHRGAVPAAPAAREPWHLAGHVDRALAALAGAGHAHVVASSLGVPVALRLALEHPGRVASLTLSGGWARTDRALRALLVGWVWTADRAASHEELLGIVLRWTRPTAAWDDGTPDELLARAAAAEAGPAAGAWPVRREAFRAAVWAALEREPALEAITAPTLVLPGAEDIVTPAWHARELAEAIPGARLEVVDGAGHEPWTDRPEEAAARFAAFARAADPAAVA